MTIWSKYAAELKLADATRNLYVPFLRYTARGKIIGDRGLDLRPYKNTWMRKRDTTYLIEIVYIHEGKKIFRHVEPWPSFPSDHLIAKLMLLPRKVNEDV